MCGLQLASFHQTSTHEIWAIVELFQKGHCIRVVMVGFNLSQSNLVFAPLVSHQHILPVLQVSVQIVVLASSLDGITSGCMYKTH